jgi:hypothetical protein
MRFSAGTCPALQKPEKTACDHHPVMAVAALAHALPRRVRHQTIAPVVAAEPAALVWTSNKVCHSLQGT